MFGAIGYNCDHVEENYRPNADSEKRLGIADAKTIYDGLNEIVKTQLTCGFCHQRVKYSIVKELPVVLTRKYDAIPARAVSVYLDSAEGISMLEVFEKAHCDDSLEILTWKNLQDMTSKLRLALEDIAYITEDVWNNNKLSGSDVDAVKLRGMRRYRLSYFYECHYSQTWRMSFLRIVVLQFAPDPIDGC